MTRLSFARPSFAVLAGLGLAAAAMAADAWPQWRGPTRDGQVAATDPAWPAQLTETNLRRRWRVELGPSYSGPIVTSDRVFTTESREKRWERVVALDRATGKEVWHQEWEGAVSVPFFAKSNGDWIRSTPAWDGTHLYVAGMKDVLVCLDGRDGAVKWRHDFPKEEGTAPPTFGFVCSPLVDGAYVYVQAGAGLAKLDKATGKVLWRVLQDGGGMDGSAFSSPVLATLAGRRQLLVQTRTRLAGVDPEQGTELWTVPIEAFRGMNILTPMPVGTNRVFTSTYGGKSQLFEIQASGTGLAVTNVWSFKAQGYMTSPIQIDGHAYLHLRNQRALCLNLATGAEQWTSGESFGKYWSLVAQGDRFLALDERGKLFLLRANPAKLEVLSQSTVGTDTWAHLAVAGHDLYIRELNGLAAYDWSDPKP
jgi:outer membrane protein assembly factor BamB